MHSVNHPPPSRQRGPHNDPSMLDGDSAHGNPGDAAGDEWAVDTDTDVLDEMTADHLDEVADDHTPDAEAERDEEAGVTSDELVDTEDVPAAATDAEEDEDDTDEEEGAEADATDDELGEQEEEDEAEGEVAADDEAATDAEIDAEGDARGPEPDETSLEVELAKRPDYDRSRQPVAGGSSAPIEGYAKLTIPQVMERAAGMTPDQVNSVLGYERANKNRKTLVAKLSKLAGAE